MPEPDTLSINLAPGVTLVANLDSPKVILGGRHLSGNILLGRAPTMIAVEGEKIRDSQNKVTGYTTYYGRLVLCFELTYRGQRRQLCYVRWLDTVEEIVKIEGTPAHPRPLTPDEQRGPFQAFYWSPHPGGYGYAGHPKRGEPHYGVVEAWQVLWSAANMLPSITTYQSSNPLFRLNTDMWDI